MNILKALNALSVRTSESDRPNTDGNQQSAAAVQPNDSGRTNLVAQTIMRHEVIANRVHSKSRR